MSRSVRVVSAVALFAVAVGIFAFLYLGRQEGGWRDQSNWRGDANIERRPRSLVLITVDTTRADRLAPYGAQGPETPTFSRLAEQGILFERAYSVAPITLVAHTSILSGLYPPEHGVRNNGTHHVPAEIETMAETLSGEGYRTAAFVSASVLEKRYGLDQGFEYYDDDLSTGRERHPRMVADRPAGAVVDSTWQWLDDLEEKERFFVWAHFYDPHAVYSPPPPYRDQYRDNLYDGEIAYMDAEIGRLLRHPRLRSNRDVVVMVVGDHGESLGEHGEETHAILAYDSTMHIPWLIWMPGGPKALRVPVPVSQVDVMPTALDLLDVRIPSGLAGESQLGLLSGQPPPERLLYGETYLPFYTYGWAKLRSLRRGAWKYIEAPTPELYDLSRDPFELSNLFDQREGLAHDLGRDLDEFMASREDPERETSLELDTDALERLRSLGYLAVGNVPEIPDEDRPDPKDVVDLHVGLERARRLMRDRLHDEAVRQLRRVLQRDPNNMAALVDLATALEQRGDVSEARSAIERALALDPNYSRLHLLMAALEARQGDLERALELVNTALGQDSQSLEAGLQRAIYLIRLGRAVEGEQAFAEVMERFPDNPRLRSVYAQLVEIPKRQYESAEEHLLAALDRDPFLVVAWRALGRLYELTARPSLAVETYTDGLRRQPDDAELHARLGLLLARRTEGSDAERHLLEAIRLATRPRSDLHVALGGWLAEQGRLSEAEQQYAIVLEREPDNPSARNNLAIAYYRSGRPELAVSELSRLIEEYPRYADALNNLAAIEIDRAGWVPAEAFARRALAVDDSLAEGWNNLGVALDEQGRLEAALPAFEKALDLESDYWRARFNLAVLYRKMGLYRDAAKTMQEVVAQVPAYADSHLELGRLYADRLNQPELAWTHFNAFLRSAPDHPEAEAVRRELGSLAR